MKNKKFLIVSIIVVVAIAVGAAVAMLYIEKTEDEKTDGIPRVYFEGDISNMLTKTDERNIKIKYVSDELDFESYATIKVQGTSSLSYDKKNYTIKFYEDETYENSNKIDVGQGWGAQSKYCLKANWIDKTHARNIVTARIVASIQEKYGLFMDTPHNGTIDGYPIEVYINGEFLGLYTWNIPKDDWMWNLDSENPNHIVIGAGKNTDSTYFKEEITDLEESGWEVEVGEESEETIEKVNRLIRFVRDSSDEEFVEHFDEYINLDAALNYISMLYISQAIDNYTKNSMYVTYDGMVWYPSLYDLDTTWGTSYDGTLLENYDSIPESTGNMLWRRMYKLYATEIAERYFELRKDILTEENIMKQFEDFEAGIPKSVLVKEQEKWANIPGQDISQIREFLEYRIPYVDNIITEKYVNKTEE